MDSIYTDDIFISYREEGETSSYFLNVSETLRTGDQEKVSRVYKNILFNINGFESSKLANLKKIENSLYKRLVVLTTEKTNKKSRKRRILKTIFTLGIYYLVLKYRESKVKEMHTSFDRHCKEVELSLQQKVRHSAIPELEALKKIRLSDPEQELARLTQVKRIKTSLAHAEKFCKYKLSIRQQVAFAQSIELREKLKDNYYVVNHGQNIEMLVVNILARKLKEVYEPEQYKGFEVLRHNTFLEKIKNYMNVGWFCKTIGGGTIDHDFRNELICGDIYLESCESYESALDFFAGRTNIAVRDSSDSSFSKYIMERMLTQYFPDPKTRSKVRNELNKTIQNLGRGGTLYSVCIPKKQFDEVAYLSRPLGYPVEKGKYKQTHLELMQDGLGPWDLREMPSENGRKVPQVRLLTHKLKPENGIMIIPNTTVDQNTLEKIEKDIDLLIQRAQMQFRL